MPIIQITYVSIESRPMSQNDLIDILTTAREKNTPQNITGMLLYRDGYFIQALEGEEEAVMALYHKIEKDERHDHVMFASKEIIETRLFGDWAMGFVNLDQDKDKLKDVPGYSNFMNEEIDYEHFEMDKSRAKNMLLLFKSHSNF